MRNNPLGFSETPLPDDDFPVLPAEERRSNRRYVLREQLWWTEGTWSRLRSQETNFNEAREDLNDAVQSVLDRLTGHLHDFIWLELGIKLLVVTRVTEKQEDEGYQRRVHHARSRWAALERRLNSRNKLNPLDERRHPGGGGSPGATGDFDDLDLPSTFDLAYDSWGEELDSPPVAAERGNGGGSTRGDAGDSSPAPSSPYVWIDRRRPYLWTNPPFDGPRDGSPGVLSEGDEWRAVDAKRRRSSEYGVGSARQRLERALLVDTFRGRQELRRRRRHVTRVRVPLRDEWNDRARSIRPDGHAEHGTSEQRWGVDDYIRLAAWNGRRSRVTLWTEGLLPGQSAYSREPRRDCIIPDGGNDGAASSSGPRESAYFFRYAGPLWGFPTPGRSDPRFMRTFGVDAGKPNPGRWGGYDIDLDTPSGDWIAPDEDILFCDRCRHRGPSPFCPCITPASLSLRTDWAAEAGNCGSSSDDEEARGTSFARDYRPRLRVAHSLRSRFGRGKGATLVGGLWWKELEGEGHIWRQEWSDDEDDEG